MARRSTAEMFGANVEESLTGCEQKDLEHSIDTCLESRLVEG